MDVINLAYILSPGHSGSTVLGLLLGAHPDVATVGELKMVPSSLRNGQLCSCGEPMGRCRFWQRIHETLSRQGLEMGSDEFDTHPRRQGSVIERLINGQVRGRLLEAVRSAGLRVWPRARRTQLQTLACNTAMIRAILNLTSCSVFLDTSKDASRLRYLSESGLFNLRVLHLIRDGRAVAYSLIRKGVAPNQAAQEWVKEHRQADRLRARLNPDHWMQVRYESLCENPAQALSPIWKFMGVTQPLSPPDFRAWDSHILGNRMRLTKITEITLDLAWREKLAGNDLATVEDVTGKLNQQYGYV